MKNDQVAPSGRRVISRTKPSHRKNVRSWSRWTRILLVLVLASPALLRCAHAGDIALGWHASTAPSVAGYKLYYGNVTRLYHTVIDVGNVVTYTVSGLPAGTYYFAVTAYSATEETGYSNEVSAVISPSDTKPPSISDVAATDVGNSAVTIRWSTDEPASSQLEYGLSASYGFTTTDDPSLVTSHTVLLSNLAAGTTYHYRVKSKDSSGNLAVSPDSIFTTTSPRGITMGRVAAYAFDEGTGLASADVSGSGNIATLRGATWTAKGRFGKALSFNGKNGYVVAGVTGLPGIGDPKTVSCWLYLNGKTSAAQSVVSLANQAAHASVQHAYRGSQVGVLQFGDSWLVAANAPPARSWHHFAYTFDGVQNRFYVDGELTSSSNIIPGAGPVAGFEIGRWIDGSAYFKGIVDEVVVYSRALNQEEIRAVMNTPLGGSSSIPVAYAPRIEPDEEREAIEEKPAAGIAEDAQVRESLVQDRLLPVVDIRMDRTAYSVGDTVTASSFSISNPSGLSRSVELKTWLVTPALEPITLKAEETAGLFTLPAGMALDIGPLSLFDILSDLPAGTWQVDARLVDPVTGDLIAEDIKSFTVAMHGRTSPKRRPLTTLSCPIQVVVENNLGETVPGSLDPLAGYRLSNQGHTAATVELKVWVEEAGLDPIPVLSLGSDASLVLPAGSELNLHPPALIPRIQDLSAGSYQLRFRILDPVTGQSFSETTDNLVIR
jgi:Concanavalin A-like lectin/glucanases superfamily/Purple acid Phosphatase, N-terminal domain